MKGISIFAERGFPSGSTIASLGHDSDDSTGRRRPTIRQVVFLRTKMEHAIWMTIK
jgi:hypothetical protein